MKYKGVPIGDLVIYKHPLLYLELTVLLLVDLLIWFKGFLIKRSLYIVGLIVFWTLVNKVALLHVSLLTLSPSNSSSSSPSTGSSLVSPLQLGWALGFILLFYIWDLTSPKLPWLRLLADMCQICFRADGISIILENAKVVFLLQ